MPAAVLVRAARPPVFLDESGRRRRLLRAFGVVVAALAVAFLTAVSSLATPPGPKAPVGPAPPASHGTPTLLHGHPAPIR